MTMPFTVVNIQTEDQMLMKRVKKTVSENLFYMLAEVLDTMPQSVLKLEELTSLNKPNPSKGRDES